MKGKRNIASKLLVRSKFIKLLGSFYYRMCDPVVILAYHRVLDIDEGFAFDHELVSASLEQFDDQVKYASENFSVITFRELSEIESGRKPPVKKPLIITFDDGFDDNYINAFRILKKYSVPAVFFVSTGYVNSTKTFWYDRLYFIVKQLDNEARQRIIQKYFKNITLSSDCDIALEVVETSKLLTNDQRVALLEEVDVLALELGIESSSKDSRPLTWQQIREMSDYGCEIGSHTVSHPIMSSLNDQELGYELSHSYEEIHRNLGVSPISIAYPVGREFAYNKKVIKKVKECGYLYGISYESGANRLHQKNKYELKRLHIERYTDHEEFVCMLQLPLIF